MEYMFKNPLADQLKAKIHANLNKWPRIAGDGYAEGSPRGVVDPANEDLFKNIFTDEVVEELGRLSGHQYYKWGEKFLDNGTPAIMAGHIVKEDGGPKIWVPFGIRVGRNAEEWHDKKKGATPQSAGNNAKIYRPQLVIRFDDEDVWEWYNAQDPTKICMKCKETLPACDKNGECGAQKAGDPEFLYIKGIKVQKKGIRAGGHGETRCRVSPKDFIEMKKRVETKSGQKIEIIPILFELKHKKHCAQGTLCPLELKPNSRYYDEADYQSPEDRQQRVDNVAHLDRLSDELVSIGHNICAEWQKSGKKFWK